MNFGAMTKFSTDAAGFAALTLCELILQQCVKKNVFTSDEARRLIQAAAKRHESCADGTEDKVSLNMETAQLLRQLSVGLEPLFKAEKNLREPTQETTAATWVRFPD
jgi:hypothetical protein